MFLRSLFLKAQFLIYHGVSTQSIVFLLEYVGEQILPGRDDPEGNKDPNCIEFIGNHQHLEVDPEANEDLCRF